MSKTSYKEYTEQQDRAANVLWSGEACRLDGKIAKVCRIPGSLALIMQLEAPWRESLESWQKVDRVMKDGKEFGSV